MMVDQFTRQGLIAVKKADGSFFGYATEDQLRLNPSLSRYTELDAIKVAQETVSPDDYKGSVKGANPGDVKKGPQPNQKSHA